ncbi:MAG: hypothetical protein C0418_04640, partial [Coriobacteriaceae bacterium]|nr:hypothetical protein [Coriobacteriaceae bacterium]
MLKTLRSRRLAVGLLTGLALYSFAATLVPRGSPDSEQVREWAASHPIAERIAAPLAMHRAYGSPAFLLLAGLLTLSTVVCSFERTTQARRALRKTGELTESEIERLRVRPQAAMPVRADIEPGAALASAADAIRGLGMRVRSDPRVAEGSAGRWGALGSPLFHWSLALLMLSAGAGQATRAEGFMGLPLQTAVREEHAGYLQISEGPLFGERHTGLDMVASDLVYQFVDGEVTRGPAPVITLLRDGAPVAS